MRLCWYGETFLIETGCGQVAKHLLPVFQEYFDEIHLIAINQFWEAAELPEGVRITCANREDLYASQEARDAIAACDYDCLFLTTDLNRITNLMPEIRKVKEAGIPIVMYAAMDCHIWAPVFWEVLKLADAPVLFSNWCARQAVHVIPELQEKVRVIYHGTEPDVFYPLSSEERAAARRDIFGIETDETFLVLNVNRNQVRKDLARSMAAFHLFHQEYPNSLLYLHAKRNDMGGDLPTQATFLGLKLEGEGTEIIFSPDGYHEAMGVTREELNRIYNAADVFMTTSTGEGWGLTTTEAMAAGVPIIGPDNTTFPEILGAAEGSTGWHIAKRGVLVPSGGPELWTVFYTVGDTPRELVSTQGMVDGLREVYLYRNYAQQRARRACAWTLEHTWSHKQQEWRELFEEVLPWRSQLRSMPQMA